MKKNKSGTGDKLLTDVELELMSILWKMGEGTVTDVLAHLSKGRALAYTSVSTMLRILQQKGVLTTRKEGRGHIYTPLLEKNAYEAKTLKHIVERVFDNTPVALVRQLLGSMKIDADEISELKALLQQLDKKK